MLFQALYQNPIQILVTFQQLCSAKLTDIGILAVDQYILFTVSPEEEPFVILDFKKVLSSQNNVCSIKMMVTEGSSVSSASRALVLFLLPALINNQM